MNETISLKASGDHFDVYVARPEGEPIGGLILIHEIWGLVDHIRDVADRYAAEGWLVAAPDILSHGGIEPLLGEELFAANNSPDDEVRVAAQPRMRDALTHVHAPEYAAWAVAALRATVDRLEPEVGERLVVTGFCFGGTYAFQLAVADPRIRASVPFYGRPPQPEQMASIGCPVLGVYGQHDPTIVDGLPEVTRRMVEAGVAFDTIVYPDAGHAFFNDTGPRYRADDAADAWARVTEFFRAHV